MGLELAQIHPAQMLHVMDACRGSRLSDNERTDIPFTSRLKHKRLTAPSCLCVKHNPEKHPEEVFFGVRVGSVAYRMAESERLAQVDSQHSMPPAPDNSC